MLLVRRMIVDAVGWAAARFQRVERIGGPLPDGPVLVVANHPNSLLDPLVIFRTAGRPTRPLAKAPLFDRPVIGAILRGLGGLPVYRRQDDPALADRNEETFRAAVSALRSGDAVQIYPEGRSHSEPSLAPLRTGAARIALRAEAESGWKLGLRVVPVGLTYSRKMFFRGRVVAAMGEPFGVAEFRDRYEAAAAEAVRSLTQIIADRLEALTLNLSEAEDRELIEVAERMYAREKGWTDWREREGLGGRLTRLQQFAEGLAWLRAHDPARHARLARAVRRYGETVRLLGAGEADVPPRYPMLGILGYAVRETFCLGLGLPAAALGLLVWYVPYVFPRLVVRLMRPDAETVATVKLAAAMVAFPVAFGLWVGAAWWVGGLPSLLAAAALLPALGFLSLAWFGRWEEVREDARLYLRVLRNPRRRDQLARVRARLVRRFDAVREEMEAERQAIESRPASSPEPQER